VLIAGPEPTPPYPLGDSVQAASGPKLRSKLRRQLAPARELGYKIGLIIYQIPEGDWLSSEYAYLDAVRQAEIDEGLPLDACWLITGNRQVVDLLRLEA
jgi:hypothetical protein